MHYRQRWLGLALVLPSLGCTTPFLNDVPEIPAPTGDCLAAHGASALVAAVQVDQISLNWQVEAEPGAQFRLERRPANESWQEIARVGAAELPYVDTEATCVAADRICGYQISRFGVCDGVAPIAITVRSVPAPVIDLATSTELSSGTRIQLTWNDINIYESGYRIERMDPGASSFASIGTRNGSTSLDSATFPDPATLAVDSIFRYRVLPFVDNGTSGITLGAPSNEALGYTAPLPPTDLTAVSAAAGSIRLSWTDASTTETGYEVERSDDGGASFVSVLSAPLAANSVEHVDEGLANDTAYAYRVRALNDLATPTLVSSWVSATGTTSPAGPSSLTAVTTPPDTIDLSWTDESSIETGYVVERSLLGGAAFVAEDTDNLAADSESFQVSGLLLDTRYFFRVYATISSGNSGYAEVSAWTQPTAPTSVGVAATAVDSIEVTWTDASSIESGYRVERSPDGSNFTLLTVTPAPANSTSYLDATIAGDRHYTYRVRAVQSAAATPSGPLTSAPASGTGYSWPLPPTNLQAAPPSTAVALTWGDANTLETGYRVDRGSGSPLTFVTLAAALAANSTGFVDNTAAADTTYVYRVYALNNNAAPALLSEPTEVSFTTAPSPPTGLTATTLSHTSIRLNWTDASQTETSFLLERLDGSMAVEESFNPAADAVTHTDANATAGNSYTYRLSASNSGGNSTSITAVGHAPAYPAPSWGAAPSLDAACVMTAPGNPGVDTARTATFASATGTLDSADATADASGVSDTIPDLAANTISIGWTVEDNYAGQGSISRSVQIRVAAAAPAVFTTAVGAPTAVLGRDAMVGRQVFFTAPMPPGTGCTTCNGLRGSLALGVGFSCALTNNGGAACWGDNGSGQLGNGLLVSGPNPWTQVCASGSGTTCAGGAAFTGIAALATGSQHACALLSDGGVRCWGYSAAGAIGDGTTTLRTLPTVVCATGSGGTCVALAGAVAVAAQNNFSCALLADGTPRCWGDNTVGQLGDGSAVTSRLNPVPVCTLGAWDGSTCVGGSPEGSAVALAAGELHACLISSGAEARCWGRGLEGQLGDGNLANRLNPGQVCASGAWDGTDCGAGGSALTGVIALALGDRHSCALVTDGHVLCWGSNSAGQLGRGGATGGTDALPGDVCVSGAWDGTDCGAGGSALTGVIALAAGQNHTCALLDTGAVRCWGENVNGELGSGVAGVAQTLPLGTCLSGAWSGTDCGAGVALADAVGLAVGSHHTCALRPSGGVSCWGDNAANAVGNNLAGTDVLLAVPVCTGGSGGTCVAFDRAARRGCGPLEVLP